jgi:hypothetical protein
LNTKLEAAASAKDEAVTKCQQLQKQQTELEEKVSVISNYTFQRGNGQKR